MLNKARKKFIIWAMVAMTVVVAVLIGAVNIVNWSYTDGKLDTALAEIVDYRNQPVIKDPKTDDKKPEESDQNVQTKPQGPQNTPGSQENMDLYGQQGNKGGKNHGRNSAVIQYSGRLATILLSETDTPQELIQDHELLTIEDAQALVNMVKQRGSSSGYYNGFKYRLVFDPLRSLNTIYALDCSTDIKAIKTMVLISVLVGLFGLILAFLFILKMSGIAVAPVKESIEKQKQFITNAGHELKTPLSAISTNMDILSMDLEDNEWVIGTKRQVGRLRKLVESLVSLSKMEEQDNIPELQSFNISRLAEECIDGFAGIAEVNGKELQTDITPDLTAYGDSSITLQLIGILCDNAIKYSVGDSPVIFKLYSDKKNVYFQSINDWEHNVDADKLDNLFERFYRGDQSRSNKENSVGYGLGLSIAKAMAEKNHGSLSVKAADDGRIIFTASLPKA